MRRGFDSLHPLQAGTSSGVLFLCPGRWLLRRRAREWNPRRNVREGSYPGVPSLGHPENRCQGRRQAPRSGHRSLTAGSSLHPLQAGTSHREVFFYAQTSREVAASQAGKGMEPETQRQRGFVSGCTIIGTPGKPLSRTPSGAAQRAPLLDGGIFPSPAPGRHLPPGGVFLCPDLPGGGCCLAGGQGNGTRDATSYALGATCYLQAAFNDSNYCIFGVESGQWPEPRF